MQNNSKMINIVAFGIIILFTFLIIKKMYGANCNVYNGFPNGSRVKEISYSDNNDNNEVTLHVENSHNNFPCIITFYKVNGITHIKVDNDLVDGKDKNSNKKIDDSNYALDDIAYVDNKNEKIGKISFTMKNSSYGYILVTNLPVSRLADTLTVNTEDYIMYKNKTDEIKKKIDITGEGLYKDTEGNEIIKTIVFWITPAGPLPLAVLPKQFKLN
jgi:hypothetical protein